MIFLLTLIGLVFLLLLLPFTRRQIVHWLQHQFAHLVVHLIDHHQAAFEWTAIAVGWILVLLIVTAILTPLYLLSAFLWDLLK